ncbi:hypothetical protein SAMN02910276_00007 [Butyrivibrio sp. Su6]|uniref:hypothetical protein n=1 Tax=Butyrivibrio sp. Su6 TaxID=1520810 RepID=UPI00089E5F31|nr:hypothetical protein [Butyrivibrio sp. Su6]SEF38927.1 hypothetical protein SAMN02910276_00007 [Butyrivibrio sp. Su6]
MLGGDDQNSLNKFKENNQNIVAHENQNVEQKAQNVEMLNKGLYSYAEGKTMDKMKKKFGLDSESGSEHKENELKHVVKVSKEIADEDNSNVQVAANAMLAKEVLTAPKEIEKIIQKFEDDGFIDLISDCNVLIADKSKIDTNVLAEFKEAADELGAVAHKYMKNTAAATPDDYDAFVKGLMRLYEAASGYISVTGKKSNTKDLAQSIYDRISAMLLADNEVVNNVIENNDSPEAIKKAKVAQKALINLNENYLRFSKELAEDPYDSPEEKLNRKLSLFNSHKAYFDDYIAVHEGNMPAEIKNLLAERKRLFSELKFMATCTKNSLALKKEEKESLFDNKDELKERNKKLDEGLTKEQERGVAEIDRWLLRNYQNGGLVGGFRSKVKKNRSEFIFSLLSMSKRERLFVYFMVESRKRVKPDEKGNDMIYSQKHYIPDLDKFKGRMIASKWLMSKRFTGDYIYWDKLDKAVSLLGSESNRNVLDEQYLEKKVVQADVDEDYEPVKKESFFKSGRLKNARREFKEAKQKAAYLNNMIDIFEKAGLLDGKGKVDLSFLEKFGVKLGRNIANSAVYTPFSVLGAIEKIVMQIKFGKYSDNPDLLTALIDILISGGRTVSSVLMSVKSIGKQIAKDGFKKFKFLDKFSKVLGIVDVGNKILQGGIWGHRKGKVTSAVNAIKNKYADQDDENLTKEKKKEKNYDQKIAALSKKVVNFKGKNLAFGSVTSGLALASAFLPGYGIVFGAATAIYATITSVLDATRENSIAKWIFDKYYDIENRYKEIVGKFKFERPDKYKLMRRLRERVASENKFTSVNSAVSSIGKDYARFIIDKVFDGTDINSEEKKPYINIIKACGLKIHEAKKEDEKNKPTVESLAYKLIGK